MSYLSAAAVVLAADPSPNPTEGTMRPDLETWEVSPGLVGFLFTFAVAAACVLLFLNMSKHLRRAGHNARQQGLEIAQPEGIGFRRTDDADGVSIGSPDGAPAAGTGDEPGSGSARPGGDPVG